MTVSVALTVVYVILATAGLVFAVGCLLFNIIFRHRRCNSYLSNDTRFPTISEGFSIQCDSYVSHQAGLHLNIL